jgi:hypothetical protein
MLLVRVNTKSLWNTNLCAYTSGCASPVGGHDRGGGGKELQEYGP